MSDRNGGTSRPGTPARHLEDQLALIARLTEQATVAVRRQAPDADREQTMLATRLLTSLWAAGLVVGVDTRDWLQHAPELPALCLRVADQVIRERP